MARQDLLELKKAWEFAKQRENECQVPYSSDGAAAGAQWNATRHGRTCVCNSLAPRTVSSLSEALRTSSSNEIIGGARKCMCTAAARRPHGSHSMGAKDTSSKQLKP
eukprot:7075810-Prymnesium_polylepis.2